MKAARNNQGFTLMELLVSMTVFLIVVTLSSGIFMQTLKSQRTVTRLSEAMNNVTLVLEQIAREARTGFNFPATDDDGSDYETLKFQDAFGDFVSYRLLDDSGRGVVGRCVSFNEAGCDTDSVFEPLTSPDINVERLQFLVRNDTLHPPLLTVAVDVELDAGSILTLQTSVSSRILD